MLYNVHIVQAFCYGLMCQLFLLYRGDVILPFRLYCIDSTFIPLLTNGILSYQLCIHCVTKIENSRKLEHERLHGASKTRTAKLMGNLKLKHVNSYIIQTKSWKPMDNSKPEQKTYGSYASKKLMDHLNQNMETH